MASNSGQFVSKFQEALNRLNSALDVLTGLQTALADLPRDPPSNLSPKQLADRTNSISKLLSRLGYDPSLQRPAQSVSTSLPKRIMGDFAKEALQERLLSLTGALEGQLNDYVNALDPETAANLGFCKVADFGPDGVFVVTLQMSFGPQQLALGKFESLPQQHPLRELIAEPYRLQGHHWNNLAVIALGPCVPVLSGSPIPRPIYSIAECQRLTGKLAEDQERERWSIIEQARQDRLSQSRDWWASELGKHCKREIDIAQMAGTEVPAWITALKEKGQIPDFVPYEPAVRG